MREEDLPKHVRKRGKNALQYRRRFEGVKDSKAVFQRAMNSKLSDDASTVQAEAAQKTKVYELELRKRTSAHPDSFTENDLDTLAAELLKQKSKQLSEAVKAGSLYPPQTHAYETADGTGDVHEQPVSEFLANVAQRAVQSLWWRMGVMTGSGSRCASINVTLNVRVFSCVLRGYSLLQISETSGR